MEKALWAGRKRNLGRVIRSYAIAVAPRRMLYNRGATRHGRNLCGEDTTKTLHK